MVHLTTLLKGIFKIQIRFVRKKKNNIFHAFSLPIRKINTPINPYICRYKSI